MDVAGNLNLNNSTIDVSGKGFRGGGGAVWDNTAGTASNFVVPTNIVQNVSSMKGEGIAGTPRLVYDPTTNAVVDLGATWGGYVGGDQGRGAPGNAGGGGNNLNGNQDNGGGGGGGNGGVGGFGGYGYKSTPWNGTITAAEFDLRGIGGAAFTQAATNRLVFGGGAVRAVTTTALQSRPAVAQTAALYWFAQGPHQASVRSMPLALLAKHNRPTTVAAEVVQVGRLYSYQLAARLAA